MQKIYLSLILVFLLSFTACSGVSELVKKPQVKVSSASLKSFSTTDATVNFSLQLNNPNAFAIKTEGLDYALNINGIQAAGGKLTNSINLAAGGSQTLELPVRFSFNNIKNLLPEILSSRRFNYKLAGSIHTRLLNVPFSKSGNLGL